jgi:hypothetical protein
MILPAILTLEAKIVLARRYGQNYTQPQNVLGIWDKWNKIEINTRKRLADWFEKLSGGGHKNDGKSQRRMKSETS